MSSAKLTNAQLDALFKENGIKGFSKLKKDEKIAKLIEAGIELPASEAAPKAKKSAEKTTSKKSTDKSNEESKEASKKASKPRVEKVDKKLIKAIDLNKYTEALTEHKEALTYSEVIDLLRDDIEAFVKEADVAECANFVNKFGALVAINYQRSHKNSKLSSKDDAEIYKILLLDMFLNGENTLSLLFKTVTKLHEKLQKPPVEKKTKKSKSDKKVVRVSAPEDDEEDDEENRPEDDEAEDVDEVEEDDVDETNYIDSDEEE